MVYGTPHTLQTHITLQLNKLWFCCLIFSGQNYGKIRLCIWKSIPRNWVSKAITGFPETYNYIAMDTSLKQHLSMVAFTLLKSYNKLNCWQHGDQNEGFTTVYNMPMFIPFSKGFQSETQFQILGFHHHFWESRKPGNPVISYPVKILPT